MLAKPSCEICGQCDWEILGERTYRTTEGQSVSAYNQKRFRVLFDKWFPGQEKVTLTSILCRHCGFIMYRPRPEEKDIDAKYRYLGEMNKNKGENTADSPVETRRSNDIYEYVHKTIDTRQAGSILDYGGGDGRLMRAFIDKGKDCFLVDYNQNCIPGVKKLADTIYDLKPEDKFDLIICSHVLEHVAQPIKTLKQISSHLSKRGHIFVELPLDIWKRIPLTSEPVTHINFFTPASLYNFLLLGGLQVLKCQMYGCLHPLGYKQPGIRAIGQKTGEPGDSNPKLQKPDARRFLKPNIISKMRYNICIPGNIPTVAWRRLKGRRK